MLQSTLTSWSFSLHLYNLFIQHFYLFTQQRNMWNIEALISQQRCFFHTEATLHVTFLQLCIRFLSVNSRHILFKVWSFKRQKTPLASANTLLCVLHFCRVPMLFSNSRLQTGRWASLGAVFQLVKVRSARAAGGLVLDGALEVCGVRKGGPAQGVNMQMVTRKWKTSCGSMFSSLLPLMAENVHAYTPHEVFKFNEIQRQQWRQAAVF